MASDEGLLYPMRRRTRSILLTALMTVALTLSTAVAASAAPEPTWEGHPPDPCLDLIVFLDGVAPDDSRVEFYVAQQLGCL